MTAVLPSAHQRVTARHLQRQAMLYVRQSTLHQVLEKTESTARQYALRERATAAFAGPASALSSSIKTWANLARRPLIVLAFNAWSPRSVSAMWAWSWA
jgi:hypothetical protein